MVKQTSLVVAGVGVVVILLVGWLVAAIALTFSAEADQKAQMQAFVEQVSIGDDKAAVENLLTADPEIRPGGAALGDDNVPEGPGIERLTVTTPTDFDVACHADFIFENDEVVYIVDPWCTW